MVNPEVLLNNQSLKSECIKLPYFSQVEAELMFCKKHVTGNSSVHTDQDKPSISLTFYVKDFFVS